MSNKKRRLQRVNRQQLIGIVLVALLAAVIYFATRDRGQVVDLHFNLPDGSKTVEFTADVMVTEQERMQGLMFIKNLPKRKGMLFVFPTEEKQSFWMKNTYIALDIIFINSQKEVVGVVHDAKPLSARKREIDRPSRYVLELNAGEADQYKISEGAKLSLKQEIFTNGN